MPSNSTDEIDRTIGSMRRPGSGDGASPSHDQETDDPDALRDRIDELEDEIDACEEAIDALDSRRETYEEVIDAHRTFDDSVHEQLREVGLDSRPSVLSVSDPESGFDAIGTGWLLAEDLLVTTATVVDGPDEDALPNYDGSLPDGPGEVALETLDGDELDVTATHVDDQSRIAVIEAETDGIEPLSVEPAADLEVGDPLLLVGHPHRIGSWVMGLGSYAGANTVDGFRVDGPSSSWSAGLPVAMNSMRGAPILDTDGRVVGVVTGTVERERPPNPESLSRSDDTIQRFPQAYDLAVVDAATVVDAASTLVDLDTNASPGRSR